MQVIATKPGYFGKLRAVGDKFEVPEGSKATWFAPVEAVKEVKPKAKADAKAEAGDLV